MLQKLFATAMYARPPPSLHSVQPPYHRFLRPNHQTVDHLMVHKWLEQRCREWDVPSYILTVDFTKAFDRVKHRVLWTSLEHYGIGPANVELLKQLCSQQEGTVKTDSTSSVSPIKRGTTRRSDEQRVSQMTCYCSRRR